MSDMLVAVCCVDETPTTFLDKFLKFGDDDRIDAKDRGDEDWACFPMIFVARSLDTHADLDTPLARPTPAFISPFLNMTITQVRYALEEKKKSAHGTASRELDPDLFIIVDSQSVVDDTVLICEALIYPANKKKKKKERVSTNMVRASIEVAEGKMAPLQVNTDIDELISHAEETGGVLQPVKKRKASSKGGSSNGNHKKVKKSDDEEAPRMMIGLEYRGREQSFDD